jgi:hypothetical protein
VGFVLEGVGWVRLALADAECGRLRLVDRLREIVTESVIDAEAVGSVHERVPPVQLTLALKVEVVERVFVKAE